MKEDATNFLARHHYCLHSLQDVREQKSTSRHMSSQRFFSSQQQIRSRLTRRDQWCPFATATRFLSFGNVVPTRAGTNEAKRAAR
ncbi:hypothetical protein BST61_g8611 [Cercospora zeina]